jgi:hypothetical protein
MIKLLSSDERQSRLVVGLITFRYPGLNNALAGAPQDQQVSS